MYIFIVKPKNRVAKDKPRHYTVGYFNIRYQDKDTLMATNYSKYAALYLKGNWLNELGFNTDQPVTITTKKDKLIDQLAK
ncbi:type I toxin-antitoxin system SymE family toxin [Gilliamella sp. B3172]|uniref:SymE family type I addiction module toxin n=1 Tax=Gilliamella sp. B3172 TaxID=2818006 RepID=UPI002A0043A5|nr:SymE family type I addiction module toxin [Gilliamella sp. B3172]MCX8640827.1 type I toxin-antitoxin system SymE family toxin [Gilliamella sp. B3172]